MPDVRSSAYFLRFVLDFSTNAEVLGPFYTTLSQTRVLTGIQSEFVVNAEPQSIIVIAGTTLILNATATDVQMIPWYPIQMSTYTSIGVVLIR